MKRKVAIVVPHQDDELIMMGAFADRLVKNSEVYVIFSTNGDYDLQSEENYRLFEATNVLKLLGIRTDNIVFYGYGDNWQGIHIYNSKDDEEKESVCGKRETYATVNNSDYHFKKYGRHALYTRNNYLCDLKDVIRDIRPDPIFCVDCDNHPDHIATSLLFEKALGEILKEDRDYRPILLKRFLYDGAWFGKSDYYLKRATIIGKNPRFKKLQYEIANPYYDKNEVISINTSKYIYAQKMEDSLIFKVAKEYKSQPLYLKMQRVLNTNSLFWWRPTDNLLYNEKISVSSGEKSYLNDFKILDCKNVKQDSIDNFCDIGWIPKEDDTEKTFCIQFDREVSVEEIRIYEILSLSSHILECELVFNNDIYMQIGKLSLKSRCKRIVLDKKLNGIR